MLGRFKEIIDTDYPDMATRQVYLAISGGKDSMVLSHLLMHSKVKHSLLHCNFNLRGKESDEDEAFIRSYASTNKLDLHVESFDTYAYMEKTGKTVQEAARDLRYNWFSSFIVNEDTLILTAHHLDDSVETFFINLLRGTGYKGLRGIPKFNLPYYRPMSALSADDIYKYIDENGINYREDSSNASTKYLRNKLRHQVLPGLAELEPKLKKKMQSLFTEMNEVDSFIQQQVNLIRSDLLTTYENVTSAYLEKIQKLDDFTVQLVFDEYGIHRSNLVAMLHFLKAKTGAKFTTETHEFWIDREKLLIQQTAEQEEAVAMMIHKFPASISLPFLKLEFEVSTNHTILKTNNPLQLDLSKIELPLTVRKWQEGDKITPLGMKGSKLISDILIDKKIPQLKKEKVMVVVDADSKIVAIQGIMISEKCKIKSNDSEVLLISSVS
jgi:tRNA(Ile)-lysidine synthase